ncbi:phage tail sheath family protein [Aureimonas leprariae]|uniref:Phage tail sheath family protein n=1 Tax=Plantimonas leprariae TaxID=2615207 RepID=A0A7V7U124_9HYPH|nr:phage tail sheath C-terminal domain-containing protein [Aureimonas leprariae]KAB0681332.1 phage tail sheath family protein [Aureimonas leprariae]
MPNYLSPGVYIEETDTGARPIEAVGTSVAGFVGTAPDVAAGLNDAVAINNFSEFVRIFAKGGTQAGAPPLAAGNHLANAVYGFFLNGGPRCYVVNSPADQPIGTPGKDVDLLGSIDEIALIAAPGRTDAASYEALIASAERLGDRVAILDGPARAEDVEQMTRAVVVGDEGGKGRKSGLRPRDSQRGFGAVYFPWIKGQDALAGAELVAIPPSGHIAGVCARMDLQRGVHKAPANTAIYGALGLTQTIGRAEQNVLNPAGVNVIRSFAREGVLVWGARTIAPSASNWRYLNVRRLASMIEESIERSMRWVVFEPNDRTLWKSIRRDIGAFLTTLWRQGALMGATPEQAFFVKCDEETNPPEEIDAGRVTTLVGIAPVKPAEFVIFRIGQTAAGATVEQV